MNKNKITLVSSFAKDRIFDKDNNLIREQKGGPAFFISNVFKKQKISFTIIPSPGLTVEIMLKDGEEFGKLSYCPPTVINYKNIDTPYLVLSSVMDEFSIENLGEYEGKNFLDAQGFTRSIGEFGKKKKWITDDEIERSIFCLKVADYELPYLNNKFIERQKQKILLLTQGAKGCTVFAFGKYFKIKPAESIKAPDTLGAGDTFFAYFIFKYIESTNPISASKFASRKTSEFIKTNIQSN